MGATKRTFVLPHPGISLSQTQQQYMRRTTEPYSLLYATQFFSRPFRTQPASSSPQSVPVPEYAIIPSNLFSRRQGRPFCATITNVCDAMASGHFKRREGHHPVLLLFAGGKPSQAKPFSRHPVTAYLLVIISSLHFPGTFTWIIAGYLSLPGWPVQLGKCPRPSSCSFVPLVHYGVFLYWPFIIFSWKCCFLLIRVDWPQNCRI